VPCLESPSQKIAKHKLRVDSRLRLSVARRATVLDCAAAHESNSFLLDISVISTGISVAGGKDGRSRGRTAEGGCLHKILGS